jgi:hypothetical protein
MASFFLFFLFSQKKNAAWLKKKLPGFFYQRPKQIDCFIYLNKKNSIKKYNVIPFDPPLFPNFFPFP